MISALWHVKLLLPRAYGDRPKSMRDRWFRRTSCFRCSLAPGELLLPRDPATQAQLDGDAPPFGRRRSTSGSICVFTGIAPPLRDEQNALRHHEVTHRAP